MINVWHFIASERNKNQKYFIINMFNVSDWTLIKEYIIIPRKEIKK